MKNTKREDISKALDNLSNRHINEVLSFEGKKKNKNVWLRFSAIAACLAILVGAIIAVPMMIGQDGPVGDTLPTDIYTPDVIESDNEGDTAITDRGEEKSTSQVGVEIGKKDVKIEVGMKASEVSAWLEDRDTFDFIDYTIYESFNGENVVIQYDSQHQYVIKVQAYPKKTVTRETFFTIKEGMDIFQVVEIVGKPRGSTFGVIALLFSNEDGFGGYVRFHSQFDMTVMEIKES